MLDIHRKDLVAGVAGSGTMGRGIVQVSAAGGMNVIAYDEKPGGAAAAKEFIAKMLDRRDRKSTRLNSSHIPLSRMPSSA